MLCLLLHSELLLPAEKLLLLVISQLSKAVGKLAGEPASNLALNVESGLLSLAFPHLRGEVGSWIDDLVLSGVDVDVILFHLGAKLSHHNS